MAYDLLFKTKVPINCSMNPDAGPTINRPTATLLGLIAASAVRGLLNQAAKNVERSRYRREFRPGHHPTLELPVVPSSRELMLGRTWSRE